MIKAINEALDPSLEKRLRKDLKRYCEETGGNYEEICKVAGLSSKGYEILSADIVEFIDQCAKGKWEVDVKTGRVNIKGDFEAIGSSWSSSDKEETLRKLSEIKFGKIEGDFRVSKLNMQDETWESICPLEVEKSIDLSNNSLTKVLLPQNMRGNIYLGYNLIESLEGCPEEIEGGFIVDNNNLKNLIGGPEKVGAEYSCSSQKGLGDTGFSLEGCAKVIKGKFICTRNGLETLAGGPEKVGNGIDIAHNKLVDLKGNFKSVSGYVEAGFNRLVSVEGLPLDMSSNRFGLSKNLIQAKVIKETYADAVKMKSWMAAYLKLAATQRFKRMGKAERDPIVSRITPELIAKNPIALAPIWKDEELLNDPVIKRRIKKSGISKDDAFQKNVGIASDLLALGF